VRLPHHRTNNPIPGQILSRQEGTTMTETMTETVTPTVYEVGKRYRVTAHNPEGALLTVGQTVECVRMPAGGSARFQEVGPEDTPIGREWIIYPSHLEALPVPTPPRRPVPGDVIRWHKATGTWTNDDRVTNDDRWVVGRVDDSDDTFTVTKEGTGEGFFTWLSMRESVVGWDESRWRAAWTFDDEWSVLIPETVEKAEHDRIVAEREAEVTRLREENDRLRRWQTSALNDAENIIGAALMEEANNRDWCSEYDEIVDKINGRTAVLSLPERENDYSCQRRVSVTVTVYVTQSGSYTGREEPDEEMVEWNDVDFYTVREAIQSEGSYLNFEVDDDDTDDFESERS
jgi:hypothetical protein